jgi:hypothetical protein
VYDGAGNRLWNSGTSRASSEANEFELGFQADENLVLCDKGVSYRNTGTGSYTGHEISSHTLFSVTRHHIFSFTMHRPTSSGYHLVLLNSLLKVQILGLVHMIELTPIAILPIPVLAVQLV